MSLEPDTYLEHLRRDGDALAVAAAKDLGAHVPSCPEWNVADLVRHTSQVHRHRIALARLGGTEFPKGLEREPGPENVDDLIDWFRGGLDELIEALREVGPDAPTWTWTGENKVRFWFRRMAQETAVHRWDAENAVGDAAPIEPALASDGIYEFLDAFIPGEELPWQGRAGTIHLHCIDVDGEWTITLEPAKVPTYETGHAKGDAAVRGPAHDLLMFVWRRLEPSAVEVLGDAALVDELWAYLRGPGP